jgi:hypothetical protein
MTLPNPPTQTAAPHLPTTPAPKKRSYAPLYWVLAVCIAPTVAAFIAFYAVDWRGRMNTATTNYGELLPNPTPMPDFTGATQIVLPANPASALETRRFDAKSLRNKWVYVTVDGGACDEPCAKRLFATRNLRAIMGRERDRVVRLWLVTDDAPIKPELLLAHPELIVLRVAPQSLGFLTPPAGSTVAQHIWIADYLARPMMRYPVEYDPDRMKKDLTKLLYASKAFQN